MSAHALGKLNLNLAVTSCGDRTRSVSLFMIPGCAGSIDVCTHENFVTPGAFDSFYQIHHAASDNLFLSLRPIDRCVRVMNFKALEILSDPFLFPTMSSTMDPYLSMVYACLNHRRFERVLFARLCASTPSPLTLAGLASLFVGSVGGRLEGRLRQSYTAVPWAYLRVPDTEAFRRVEVKLLAD